jgi:hypothetical protein
MMTGAWNRNAAAPTHGKGGQGIFWLSFIAVSLAISSASAQTQCVGRWRVSVEATSGTCEPNEHNRAVNVRENGQIVLENPSSRFTLSGSVSGCQTMSFVITRGPEIARGNGRVTGDRAEGTWKVIRPPEKQCSGTWLAVKH